MPKKRTDRVRKRVGLRRPANETVSDPAPGSSLDYLVETGTDDDLPADVSERPEHYLHGGKPIDRT